MMMKVVNFDKFDVKLVVFLLNLKMGDPMIKSQVGKVDENFFRNFSLTTD